MLKLDFYITPSVIAQDDKLRPLDGYVYGAIYALNALENGCIASNDYIAKMLNCSTVAVKKGLQRLEERGYIKRLFDAKDPQIRKTIVPLIKFGRGDTSVSGGVDTLVPEGGIQVYPIDIKDYKESYAHSAHSEPHARKSSLKVLHPTGKIKVNNKIKSMRNIQSDEDSYAIDVDTGETTEIEKRILKGGKTVAELLKWSEERRGSRFVQRAKQVLAICRMKAAKIAPDVVKDRWLELEEDKYWSVKGFDWTTVANSFDKKL